jgi:hypothetical protein
LNTAEQNVAPGAAWRAAFENNVVCRGPVKIAALRLEVAFFVTEQLPAL